MRINGPRTWRTFAATIGCMAALALFVAGCGGSTATGSTQPTATTPSNPTTPPNTAPATATTGASGSGGATIAMGQGHFTGNTTVTIKAGQSVVFDDSAGGPHDLVIGTHGLFTNPEAGAPTELNNKTGVSFGGGDKNTIVFPTAGTYDITCTFHPTMQATVTVTP